MSAEKRTRSEVRIHSEIGNVMLVTFSRTAKPVKALYVGMENGTYLILRFPSGSGVHDHLYEGNSAVVKFVSDGKVYGFRTEVLGYLYKKRILLVVFTYPKAVEIHPLRKEQRVEFLLPAKLFAESKVLDGFVVDISPSGCRFSTDIQQEESSLDFEAIQQVAISFQLIGLEGEREFQCHVQNVKLEKNRLNLGLVFQGLEESITEGIREYVSQVSRFLDI